MVSPPSLQLLPLCPEPPKALTGVLHTLEEGTIEIASAQQLKAAPVTCLRKFLLLPEGCEEAACNAGAPHAQTCMGHVQEVKAADMLLQEVHTFACMREHHECATSVPAF